MDNESLLVYALLQQVRAIGHLLQCDALNKKECPVCGMMLSSAAAYASRAMGAETMFDGFIKYGYSVHETDTDNLPEFK